MKKILLAFLAAAFTHATFSQSLGCGLDIAWGFLTGASTQKYELPSGVAKRGCFEFGFPAMLPTKVSTYNCPWVQKHIGIYGSINLAPLFETTTSSYGWQNKGSVDFGAEYGLSFEMMVGPAFGFNFGDIRFQGGLAFHLMAAHFWVKEEIEITTLGLALTPQLRFGRDKKRSFILGVDFVFDFFKKSVYTGNFWGKFLNGGANKKDYERPKNYFRFAAMPYIGFGLNF